MEDFAMIKLSFIVPIYNVASYLRMCVESLLDQDLAKDEYEIILVDDGSTDSCPEICDEYERMFDNIRVIHQKNGGLSAARNSGIKVAKGEYICFVDGDDYWQRNVLAGLITQMERDNLDVIRFRLQYVNPEGEVYNPYKSDPFKGNDYSEVPTDGVSFLNSRMSTACYAWAFILRRDLIVVNPLIRSSVNTLFTEGIYFEDTDWTPRMLCKANRVASTQTVVYNYLQREGSITNAVNRSKQKKVLDDKVHLIATLQQQAIDLRKRGRYNRWYRDMISDLVVSIIGMLSVDFYDDKEAYLTQLQQLQIYPLQTHSLKARLINLSPIMTVKLLHFKNS